MGFFSRLPVPRGMRRATHPEPAVAAAVTPEAVEVAHHAPHAADNGHSAAAIIKAEANGNAGIFRHGDCPVNHRSAPAAAKCRNR